MEPHHKAKFNVKAVTRRETFKVTGLAIATLILNPTPTPAAQNRTAKDVMDEFTGGKQPKPGNIYLEMPEVAENGHFVSFRVSVDSPMTAENHVKRVIVISEGNPRPEVATFHFSPKSGKAEVASRMRLAKTQNILAIAELSDGSFYITSTDVKVTIGGCGV